MQLANESVEQRHRQRRKDNNYERQESTRRLRSKPKRKKILHLPQWRPPEPWERGKRRIYGRPHTWNEQRNGWVDNSHIAKKQEVRTRLDGSLSSSRKRSRSSTTDREEASQNFFSGDEFSKNSGETQVKRFVKFSAVHTEKIHGGNYGIDGRQRDRHEIRDNDETCTPMSSGSEDMLNSQNDKEKKIEMDTSLSNLQTTVDNLKEENAMWKQRYELLRKEYEEQMELKNQIEQASSNQLQDLESKVTEAKADREKESVLNDFLRKDMTKLESDLTKQTEKVNDQQKYITQLQQDKEKLEGQIEDLKSDNQVYAERLEASKLALIQQKESSRVSDDAHQKSLQETLERHRNELEKERALISTQKASVNISEARVKWKAELESKTKECMDLQNNFNTIAMQSVKQSNKIEEQRQTIHRLREQLDASMGNAKVPLKVEDC